MTEQRGAAFRDRRRFTHQGSLSGSAGALFRHPSGRFSAIRAAAGARADISLRDQIFIDVEHCTRHRQSRVAGSVARENALYNRRLHAAGARAFRDKL